MTKRIFEITVLLAILFGLSMSSVFSDGSHTLLPDTGAQRQSWFLLNSQNLKRSIELHLKQTGSLPKTLDDLKSFDPPPSDSREHVLSYKLAEDGRSYTLTGAGADGLLNTEDDMTYQSATDTFVEPKKNDIARNIQIGLSILCATAYIFSLLFLSPHVFFRAVYRGEHRRRIQVLLCLLMASSFYTWPNLIPMALAYFSSTSRKWAPLKMALFIVSNVSIFFLVFFSKRFRST